MQIDDLDAGGSILFMRSRITNNSFRMRNSQDLEIITEIKGVSVTKECYGLEGIVLSTVLFSVMAH